MTRRKRSILALVAVAALAGAGLLVVFAGGGLIAQDETAAAADEAGQPASAGAPGEQPFVFPHDIHAGELQMDCMYCHYSADRSVDAGIPPMSVCAGCHMPAGAPLFSADSARIQTLAEYWQNSEPIPWDRDHDIPDHAHFPHMMHVNADVQCQECHGNVEEVEEVEQVESLEMGWCIDCHRTREVRTDCTVCHY